MYRNYAPSVADTMSVWSGPSVHGSIYGNEKPKALPPRPAPLPKPQVQKVELMPGNPYANFRNGI